MSMTQINHSYLFEKQSAINSGEVRLPFNLDVKVRRALSWMKQAEDIEDSNSDNRFLFYWIAFNALYSSKIEDSGTHTNEHVIYRRYFKKLLNADKKKRIYNMVWGHMKPQFRQLITNKYLFGYFWKFHNNELEAKSWDQIFQSMNKKFQNHLKYDRVPEALADVFSRLYVLRNQIIHGGSTWGGDRNRNQVKICSKVISVMVPLMVDIMLDSPDVDWGDLHYPVLDKADNRLGDADSGTATVWTDVDEEDKSEDTENGDDGSVAPSTELVEIPESNLQHESAKEVKTGLIAALKGLLGRVFRRK